MVKIRVVRVDIFLLSNISPHSQPQSVYVCLFFSIEYRAISFRAELYSDRSDAVWVRASAAWFRVNFFILSFFQLRCVSLLHRI